MAHAQAPLCSPCAGIRIDNPEVLLAVLESEPRLEEGALLYVAWAIPLVEAATVDVAPRIVAMGATPVLGLIFKTPFPLSENLETLEAELRVVSRLAREADPQSQFQVFWQPVNAVQAQYYTDDYSFLLKRAAVTVTGGQPRAKVLTQPLDADPDLLLQLFNQGISAYLDAIVLRSGSLESIRSTTRLLMDLDPGKPVVVDGSPIPTPPERVLSQAARHSSSGVAVTIFQMNSIEPQTVSSLKLLANEFRGDLAPDPYSIPRGDSRAWSFVRGEDLGLRVIIEHDPDAAEAIVTFSDGTLRQPSRIDLETGRTLAMHSGTRSAEGLELHWAPSATVSVLRLERPTPSEREGVAGLEEEVDVVSARQLPVEEILRRLQAFEDAQARRLQNYQGLNTTHLRFEFESQGLEVTFEGRLFFARQKGYDWAWERFFINGLKWKGRNLPKIPLIQPERAANLPLEINFNQDYSYRLGGTATVEGRDCWVVEFRPQDPVAGTSLFRGTVWIDREHFARVRSRAVQLGLEGDVISNEETLHYYPIDHNGQPSEWHPDSYWLPLRTVSQQIWSIFNTALVVEKETVLSEVAINRADQEEAREAILQSDFTMVRDTPEGLRYLVKDKKTGARAVQDQLDSSRLFLVGGVLYDDALEYPLPLAGIDYFSLDFKDTGTQVNAFFAGALLTASIADASVMNSRLSASSDLFLLAVPFTDTLYRNGEEIESAEIRERPASIDAEIGRLFGAFTKVNLIYELRHSKYSRSDNTAEDFVLPQDHFTNELGFKVTYTRTGYRLRARGIYAKRSSWEPWGVPASGEFDPDTRDFLKWRASVAKTFYLPHFRQFGIKLEYADGQDLDRFSKYQFGTFSEVRVSGYQTGKIRAERALVAHFSYGIEMGELFRLEGLVDTALANDELEGLNRDLLAGIGVAGVVVGPWKTLVRLDAGIPVAGPDDGFTLFLTFLKLFK